MPSESVLSVMLRASICGKWLMGGWVDGLVGGQVGEWGPSESVRGK